MTLALIQMNLLSIWQQKVTSVESWFLQKLTLGVTHLNYSEVWYVILTKTTKRTAANDEVCNLCDKLLQEETLYRDTRRMNFCK